MKPVHVVEMSKWIRLSKETYGYLVQQGQFKESFDMVLQRLLGLKSPEK